MTYPEQPGNWSDASWPTPQAYPQSAVPASPGYGPQSVPAGYALPYQPYPAPPSSQYSGLTIAAFVLAIAGIVTCGVTSLVGAIMGHVTRRQIAERGEAGDGFAVAAIAIGWIIFGLHAIGILGYIVVVVIFAAALASSADTSTSGDGSEWGDVFQTLSTLAAACC